MRSIRARPVIYAERALSFPHSPSVLSHKRLDLPNFCDHTHCYAAMVGIPILDLDQFQGNGSNLA